MKFNPSLPESTGATEENGGFSDAELSGPIYVALHTSYISGRCFRRGEPVNLSPAELAIALERGEVKGR